MIYIYIEYRYIIIMDNDINNKFNLLISNKTNEINEIYLTKFNKKFINNHDDIDKIDYTTNKTISNINKELDRKYKLSKKYKNSIQ